MRPLHLEPSPLVLDVVQDPRDGVLLRPGQLGAWRGPRRLGGRRTPTARRSVSRRKVQSPPGSLLRPGRGRHPRATATAAAASGQLVHCVRGPGRGAEPDAGSCGEGRGRWPRADGKAGAGRERAGEWGRCRVLAAIRAGSCRPPPLQSLLHLPVSLTHFGERGGGTATGGREGGGGTGEERRRAAARPPARQLGRWLAHGTPGSGRLGGRTPDNQIESGLTLDGCTEDAPRSGGGESLGHAPTPAPAPPPVFRLSTSGIPGCSRDFAERVGLELSGCLLHADIFGSGEGLAHGAGVKLGVSCPGMPDVSLSNSSRVLLNSQRIAPLSLLVTHLSSSVVAPVSLRDPGGRSPLANGPDSSDFCTSSRASPRPASLVPLQGCLF